jgi:RNA ligase (TIGR02306 family)
MRKLASIKTVLNLVPIEGRDKIELAIIDGWSVIVKKGEFQIGGKCVYCEIDSVMPETEQFEFLRSKNFRIKTMKMAGVVSQGICFPLSILPQGDYKVEQDVTEILKIKQYEPTMDKGTEPVTKAASKTKYPKWLMKFGFFRQWVYKRDHREGKGFHLSYPRPTKREFRICRGYYQIKTRGLQQRKSTGRAAHSRWCGGNQKFRLSRTSLNT